MSEARLVIWIACSISLMAVLATLIVIPQLYSEFSQLTLRIRGGVQVLSYLIN
jgi:hypothetical protein